MRELAFVGLADDGVSLVLSSSDGTRYTVPCDERLEAAVRRDRSRLGQLEIALDGTSPRDIQLRVRHGQSPDDIAASSGLPVERVLRFAGPVLAEREHMAAQARETELREGGSARTVAATVAEVLSAGGVDTELLEWDAWRRDDGRWSLLASWEPVDSVALGATAALWIYDPAGRTVVADDPASAWLFGEQSTVALETEARPYLVGLPGGEVSDGEESWEDDIEDPDAAFTAIVERSSGAEVVELLDRPPAEPDDAAPLDDLYDTLPGLARPEAPAPPRRTRRKAKGEPAAAKPAAKQRASVPSWDEILFGTRPPEG
ncbi:MAG TPA: septation protein SepH [Candidatus Nanopelagicales bacterium]|nr:septation protein SepH [Candidatus Nanopelagicales bacterium]